MAAGKQEGKRQAYQHHPPHKGVSGEWCPPGVCINWKLYTLCSPYYCFLIGGDVSVLMEVAQRQSVRLRPYHNFSFEMFLSKNEEKPGNDWKQMSMQFF